MDAAARDALVERCLSRADSIARRAARRHPRLDEEELIEVAREALVREAGRMDPNLTANLEGTLLWRVDKRVDDWLRQNGPVRELRRGRSERSGEWAPRLDEVSLDTPVASDGDGSATIGDVIPAPADPVDLADHITLRQALDGLSEIERKVLNETYLHDRTGEDLALELGVTPQRVSQIRSQALVRLQGSWEPPEEPAPAASVTTFTAGGALTDRELRALAAAADGLTNEETAERFSLPLETVKTHRKKCLRKLGARSIGHAIALAFRAGLLR